MNGTKRYLIIGLLAFILVACSAPAPDRIAPEVGAFAPDFELVDISGKMVRLSDFLGRPVLINFWATWCPPCLMEMPDIHSRYEAFYPELVVLAVDEGETADVVQAFSQYAELSFDPLLDEYGEVGKLYQVRGNPTSFFIDAEGVVRVLQIGMMTGDLLDRNLAKIGLE